jgi:hypothetical protein
MFEYISPAYALHRHAKRNRKEREKFRHRKRSFNQEREQYEAGRPGRDLADQSMMDQAAQKEAEQSKMLRHQGRQEGRAYAKDVLGQDIQGLTPNQRSAMQYEANKNIQRQVQGNTRKLLGEQGRRGIAPRSGVGFEQQREIQRAGNQAQGQATRDLHRLDADMALKKLAAGFNIEQGEAAQNQIDRQIAQDRQELMAEKRRARANEGKFNRLFNRI